MSAQAGAELDGVWKVERRSGLLPPMLGVRKRIAGGQGHTLAPLLPPLPFRVVGLSLRYERPLAAVVDLLEPDGEGGYRGTMTVLGRPLARFALRRIG